MLSYLTQTDRPLRAILPSLRHPDMDPEGLPRVSSRIQASSIALSGMKTILIPTEDHQWMPAVLETARLIASRFDSYIEGIAVRPAGADFVTVEPVSSLAIASVEQADAEIALEA